MSRRSSFHRPLRLALSLVLAGLLMAACTRETGDATYRDPPSGSAPEWHVALDSGVTIGRENAGPKYQLFNVLTAIRRPDGAVVVGDGTGELRFFDATGRFVKAVGRKGRGPGEFQIPVLIARIHGDSLAVWDGSQGRISVFDSAGVLGRTLEPRLDHGLLPRVVAIFADGGLAVKTGSNARAMRQRSGLVADSAGFEMRGADGALVRDLGRAHVGDVYVTHRGSAYGWSTPPFGRELYTAGSPTALYVADGGTNLISVYTPDGRRVRTIAGPFAPRPVTSAALRRLKRETLDEVTDPARRALLERELDGAPAPRRTPTFGAIAADGEGLLWVQEYPAPGAADAHWAAIRPDGRVAAVARTRRSFLMTVHRHSHSRYKRWIRLLIHVIAASMTQEICCGEREGSGAFPGP